MVEYNKISIFLSKIGLHRDTLPLQGLNNAAGVIRRTQQPLHWVYPQPQQQHHRRSSSSWGQNVNTMSVAGKNSSSLDVPHASNMQTNMISNQGGNHALISTRAIDSSSDTQGSSLPPPSIKNGSGGCGNSTSSITSSDNDDEWKNIHVVRMVIVHISLVKLNESYEENAN